METETSLQCISCSVSDPVEVTVAEVSDIGVRERVVVVVVVVGEL